MHLETKIDEGAWEITSGTKIRSYTSKNAAPKQKIPFYLSLFTLFTSQTNLVFKYNLLLMK